MLNFLDLINTTNISGKRIFIRSDLNVPINKNGKITDDTRIRASIPTIKTALNAGAAVMVTSHIGRPIEGVWKLENSLSPVAERLSVLLNRKVPLIKNWIENKFIVDHNQLVLLENCRINKGESTNSYELAKYIASMIDIYVNDAFGTAHRTEVTTCGLAYFSPIACAGPLLIKEINNITNLLDKPLRPLTAIISGSKISTKLGILEFLSSLVDNLILGGGIANTFILSAGFNIGKSLAELDLVSKAQFITELAKKHGTSISIPIDSITAKICNASAKTEIKTLDLLSDNDLILDIGPKTISNWVGKIKISGTIIWNGPLGVFEITPFEKGTKAIATAIANSTAFSVVGGGDTIAAINKYNLTNKINYVSTGGGAFLECIKGNTLPAVLALMKRNNSN